MKKWLALGCTLALMALLFVLSAQSGTDSRQLSDAAAELAQQTGADVLAPNWFYANSYANIRKWAHIYLYAALGASMMVTVHLWRPRALRRQAALAAALCFAYSVSDEVHQFFVPGRAAQWQDLFVDAAGWLPGILLVCWLIWRRQKR